MIPLLRLAGLIRYALRLRTFALLVALFFVDAGASTAQSLSEHEPLYTIPKVAREGATFGKTLAVGDFNADGFDDLAAGVPRENLDDRYGSVNLIFGDSLGLSFQGVQVLSCTIPGFGIDCVSESLWG